MSFFTKQTTLIFLCVIIIFGAMDLLGGRKSKAQKGIAKKSTPTYAYTPKEGDVTGGISVEQLSNNKPLSTYTMTIERLLLFYKEPVDQDYLKVIEELYRRDTMNYDSVDSRMEAFVDFSQKEGRKLANLKIKKIYCLNDFQLRALTRKYNEYAKTTGASELTKQYGHTFSSGIRQDFLIMDKETRKAARVKDCQRIFVKFVKLYINKKTPLSWSAVLNGRGGLFLITGYNDTDKEIIYYNKEKCQRISYEDAWGSTTGMYIITPRVTK